MTILILLLAGIAGGVLLGLIGVGMALVAVPALIFVLPLMGVPGPLAPQVALATSMGIVTLGSISSVIAHHRLGNIDWTAFTRIVPFSLVGVLLGSLLVTWLPGSALRLIFAAFLLFIAARMLIGRRVAAPRQARPAADRAAGAAIGFAGALIGAGGGVFMVPYLSAQGQKMVRAVATSATIGLPVTIVGTGFHALRPLDDIAASMIGSIHVASLIGLGLGGMIGAPLGARWASRVPGQVLKRAFGVMLLVLAIGLIADG